MPCPPRPVLRTRGVLTFAGPVERQTRITPAGPVARVTYRWDVRPGVPEPITLSAIAIPWFDTRARVMREAEIPARIVGGRAAKVTEEAPPPPASPWRALAAGLAAFGLGLGAWGVSRHREAPAAPALRALTRAARRRDARGFHAALTEAARRDPALAAAWRTDPGSFRASTLSMPPCSARAMPRCRTSPALRGTSGRSGFPPRFPMRSRRWTASARRRPDLAGRGAVRDTDRAENGAGSPPSAAGLFGEG